MFDEFMELYEVEHEEYCKALYEAFKELSDEELRKQLLGTILGGAEKLSEENRESYSKVICRILDERYVESILKEAFKEMMKTIARLELKKIERRSTFSMYVDTSFRQINTAINNRISEAEQHMSIIGDEDLRETLCEKIKTLKDVKKDLRKWKKEYMCFAKEIEAQIMKNCQNTELRGHVEKIVREEYRKLVKTCQFKRRVYGDMEEEKIIYLSIENSIGRYAYPTEANIKGTVRTWFECGCEN